MKYKKKIVVAAMAAAVFMTQGCAFLPLGEVAEGVHFESQNMADLNEEAVQKIVRKSYEEAPKYITLVSPSGQKEKYPLSDMGIQPEPLKTVEKIMSYGYEENLKDAYKARWELYQNPVDVEKEYSINEVLLKAFFKNYALEHNIPLGEGSLAVKDNAVVYVPPEKEEKVIDTKAMAKEVIKGLQDHKVADLSIRFTEADTKQGKPRSLQSINTVLGSYTSTFNPGATNRVHNIILATEKVNGTIIKPNEVFSYNHIVGERTAAAGYAEAPVIINGKLEPGIGGGICQLSSTLFGATLRSGLPVVERTNHYSPIGYMPLGQDATVSYGSLDYKFKNDYSHPIYVDAHVNGNELTVHILGNDKDLVKNVAIENTEIKDVPFKVFDDKGIEIPQKEGKENIPEGYKVKTPGHKGLYVTTARKIIGADGKGHVETYTSYYNAQNTILEKAPKVEKKEKEESKEKDKEHLPQ